MPAEEGAIPGRYNLVEEDKYEKTDRQVPIEDFIDSLEENQVPDEVTVNGLEEAFEYPDLKSELIRLMRERSNDLENRNPLPVIQFAVEGRFHRVKRGYDLKYEDEIYDLTEIFHRDMNKEGDGWITATF